MPNTITKISNISEKIKDVLRTYTDIVFPDGNNETVTTDENNNVFIEYVMNTSYENAKFADQNAFTTAINDKANYNEAKNKIADTFVIDNNVTVNYAKTSENLAGLEIDNKIHVLSIKVPVTTALMQSVSESDFLAKKLDLIDTADGSNNADIEVLKINADEDTVVSNITEIETVTDGSLLEVKFNEEVLTANPNSISIPKLTTVKNNDSDYVTNRDKVVDDLLTDTSQYESNSFTVAGKRYLDTAVGDTIVGDALTFTNTTNEHGDTSITCTDNNKTYKLAPSDSIVQLTTGNTVPIANTPNYMKSSNLQLVDTASVTIDGATQNQGSSLRMSLTDGDQQIIDGYTEVAMLTIQSLDAINHTGNLFYVTVNLLDKNNAFINDTDQLNSLSDIVDVIEAYNGGSGLADVAPRLLRQNVRLVKLGDTTVSYEATLVLNIDKTLGITFDNTSVSEFIASFEQDANEALSALTTLEIELADLNIEKSELDAELAHLKYLDSVGRISTAEVTRMNTLESSDEGSIDQKVQQITVQESEITTATLALTTAETNMKLLLAFVELYDKAQFTDLTVTDDQGNNTKYYVDNNNVAYTSDLDESHYKAFGVEQPHRLNAVYSNDVTIEQVNSFNAFSVENCGNIGTASGDTLELVVLTSNGINEGKRLNQNSDLDALQWGMYVKNNSVSTLVVGGRVNGSTLTVTNKNGSIGSQVGNDNAKSEVSGYIFSDPELTPGMTGLASIVSESTSSPTLLQNEGDTLDTNKFQVTGNNVVVGRDDNGTPRVFGNDSNGVETVTTSSIDESSYNTTVNFEKNSSTITVSDCQINYVDSENPNSNTFKVLNGDTPVVLIVDIGEYFINGGKNTSILNTSVTDQSVTYLFKVKIEDITGDNINSNVVFYNFDGTLKANNPSIKVPRSQIMLGSSGNQGYDTSTFYRLGSYAYLTSSVLPSSMPAPDGVVTQNINNMGNTTTFILLRNNDGADSGKGIYLGVNDVVNIDDTISNVVGNLELTPLSANDSKPMFATSEQNINDVYDNDGNSVTDTIVTDVFTKVRIHFNSLQSTALYSLGGNHAVGGAVPVYLKCDFTQIASAVNYDPNKKLFFDETEVKTLADIPNTYASFISVQNSSGKVVFHNQEQYTQEKIKCFIQESGPNTAVRLRPVCEDQIISVTDLNNNVTKVFPYDAEIYMDVFLTGLKNQNGDSVDDERLLTLKTTNVYSPTLLPLQKIFTSLYDGVETLKVYNNGGQGGQKMASVYTMENIANTYPMYVTQLASFIVEFVTELTENYMKRFENDMDAFFGNSLNGLNLQSNNINNVSTRLYEDYNRIHDSITDLLTKFNAIVHGGEGQDLAAATLQHTTTITAANAMIEAI